MEGANMNLNNEILNLLKNENCHIVGFADLSVLPSEARLNFKYGIVMALPFSPQAILENKNNNPQRYYNEHEPMNIHLAKLKNLVADYLNAKAYETTANTPATELNQETLSATLSQKTVATLAGIGFIGKCAMLICKQAGSAVRLTTVLTNAPLACGVPITKSGCPANCNICTKICPGNAVKGPVWEADLNRDDFFDAFACRDASRARAKTLLNVEASICGLCMAHCPFTKEYINESSSNTIPGI